MSDLRYIFWRQCSQCGYETAAHGQVKCPDCEILMTTAATAGAIIDTRGDEQEPDALVLIDNENMDRLRRGFVDTVSIRYPDGHGTIDAKLTEEGQGYVNGYMSEQERETLGGELQGVTCDDLESAKHVLTRFEDVALEEFDDVPDWLTTAIVALWATIEHYDTEVRE